MVNQFLKGLLIREPCQVEQSPNHFTVLQRSVTTLLPDSSEMKTSYKVCRTLVSAEKETLHRKSRRLEIFPLSLSLTRHHCMRGMNVP